MKMKKFLVMVTASLLALSVLTACGDSSSSSNDESDVTVAVEEEEELTIGFMNTNLSNEFQVSMLDAARVKADELGIKLVEQDGMGDASKQITQMEQLIQQKVDAVVFAPYDYDACAPAVQKAVDAGIPCIVVNSTVSNLDLATAYVGSNDVNAGEMAMSKLAEEIGGEGNIMILHGPFGNSAEVGRSEGAENILADYPDINVVFEDTAEWDREKAMKLTENKLTGGLDIVGVFAQNDEMAIGAYKAIEAAGLQDSIKVIGVDAIADALTSVQNGEMIATVFQNAKSQAATAVEVAVSAAKGEAVDKEYLIPFELVTKDNVEEYK